VLSDVDNNMMISLFIVDVDYLTEYRYYMILIPMEWKYILFKTKNCQLDLKFIYNYFSEVIRNLVFR